MHLFPQFILAGNASEAIEFYSRVLGAYNQGVLYYGDVPFAGKTFVSDEQKSQVLCARLNLDGQRIYLSDAGQENGNHTPVQVVAVFEKRDGLYRVYEHLRVNGQVLVDPQSTFDGRFKCMVQDRFGIVWNLMLELEK